MSETKLIDFLAQGGTVEQLCDVLASRIELKTAAHNQDSLKGTLLTRDQAAALRNWKPRTIHMKVHRGELKAAIPGKGKRQARYRYEDIIAA
jgi:hypothetical protein